MSTLFLKNITKIIMQHISNKSLRTLLLQIMKISIVKLESALQLDLLKQYSVHVDRWQRYIVVFYFIF